MKTKKLTVIILALIIGLGINSCSVDNDEYLSEKQNYSMLENVPNEISLFITQNFNSYQSYLYAGGIPVEELMEILDGRTRASGDANKCFSKYYNDQTAFQKCLNGIELGDDSDEPNKPDEPDGPEKPDGPEPGDPNSPPEFNYVKFEDFFQKGTIEYEVIKSLNFNIPASIIAAQNILRQVYPEVIIIVETYGLSAVHYGPSCLDGLLSVAQSLGLKDLLFENGSGAFWGPIPNLNYRLLENISEFGDGYRILVYNESLGSDGGEPDGPEEGTETDS